MVDSGHQKGVEGSRIQGFRSLSLNDFIDKYPEIDDMISTKYLNPCIILAFHSNPQPLGALNPGEDIILVGDEPKILMHAKFLCSPMVFA
jgi:hypothetical protein